MYQASLPTAQPHTPGETHISGKNIIWEPMPTFLNYSADTTVPTTSQSASTPTNPSLAETSQEQGSYHTQTWKQDVPVSHDLAFALAASTNSNDVVLAHAWSVKLRLPDVKDDGFVSALRAEALLLERRATLENLLNKPRAELEARREEMREARKALERANSDMDSKREIEDFLNQYPDRPLVPEH
ncbi:hypothetical protein FRC00_003797 [Tulasnella sp. 408]|nr:hypothetical protein FRC00_003797 [Tulasnella sp. 408]